MRLALNTFVVVVEVVVVAGNTFDEDGVDVVNET